MWLVYSESDSYLVTSVGAWFSSSSRIISVTSWTLDAYLICSINWFQPAFQSLQVKHVFIYIQNLKRFRWIFFIVTNNMQKKVNISKQSLTGLNSDVSFSLTSRHAKMKEPCLPYYFTHGWRENSRIHTFYKGISLVHYLNSGHHVHFRHTHTHTHIYIYSMCVCVCVCVCAGRQTRRLEWPSEMKVYLQKIQSLDRVFFLKKSLFFVKEKNIYCIYNCDRLLQQSTILQWIIIMIRNNRKHEKKKESKRENTVKRQKGTDRQTKGENMVKRKKERKKERKNENDRVMKGWKFLKRKKKILIWFFQVRFEISWYCPTFLYKQHYILLI